MIVLCFPAVLSRLAGTALLAILCLLLSGCSLRRAGTQNFRGAGIEFTTIPTAGADNPEKVSTIEGRVIGAKPGEQVVLYAKGKTTWWVQPLADQPFTKIQSDFEWSNSTHPGTEYAALLVEPGFRPPPTSETLPTHGVVAFAVAPGGQPLWQRWWFPIACVIAVVLVISVFHLFRVHQMTRELNARFEERLAERMRVARELHDTLLQGVLSASMQLDVALDKLPADSSARPALERVLELMGRVIEEGRNTVRGLRSSIENPHDLERAFLRIPQELSSQPEEGFRVIVAGTGLPLLPAVRDDVYSIGREALENALRHSQASKIQVELEYAPAHLRVLISGNGRGIEAGVLRSGRDGHWGLSGMRERAERIGAKLKIVSSPARGTEIELRVPSRVAFESHPSNRASIWWTRIFAPKVQAAESARGEQAGEINERA